jgi:hypothetical protein
VRCQPTTVSGLTITRTSVQRDHSFRSAIQKNRSNRPKRWTRPFPLEDGDLLPKNQDLQGGVLATAEEDANGSQKSKDELEHKPYVVACRNTLGEASGGGPQVVDHPRLGDFGYTHTEHLARAAVVYVCQSTLGQVEHHTESKRRQYSLVDTAAAVGLCFSRDNR